MAGKAVPIRELDFYDLKGAVEAVFDALGQSNNEFRSADVQHLQKGQAASIVAHGKTVGYMGRLNDDIAGSFKFKRPVYIAEIDLQQVLKLGTSPVIYRPLTKYPAIVRDVSFVIDRTMSFATIKKAIESQGRELCRSIKFVDVFEGKGLSENERSITIRLEYRSDESTLIESEVEEIHNGLLRQLEQEIGIKPRF